MANKRFGHVQGLEQTKSPRISHAQVRKLAIAAMFIALEFILAFTSIGLIPLGIVNITTLHIPLIIAILMEGMGTGSVVALTFGSLSLYKAFSAPALVGQLFRNPLVSILPRLMIVPATYFAFVLCKYIVAHIGRRKGTEEKSRTKLCYGIAAGLGSLSNTLFTVSAMSIAISASPASIGITPEAVQSFLYGLWASIAVNALLECVVSVVIVTGIALALERVKKIQFR